MEHFRWDVWMVSKHQIPPPKGHRRHVRDVMYYSARFGARLASKAICHNVVIPSILIEHRMVFTWELLCNFADLSQHSTFLKQTTQRSSFHRNYAFKSNVCSSRDCDRLCGSVILALVHGRDRQRGVSFRGSSDSQHIANTSAETSLCC